MLTRFIRLHRPRLVEVADSIARLALDAEKKTGKPIIYGTVWDIAQAVHVNEQTAQAALRLTYTAEFMEEYGYGFMDRGNGRSGAIYGYILLQRGAKKVVSEAFGTLADDTAKLYDHLHGDAAHCEHLALACGSTKDGKEWARLSMMLDGVAAQVEAIADRVEADAD